MADATRNEEQLERLERDYQRLVAERHDGDLLRLLHGITVGCRDVVAMCKFASDKPMDGEECCQKMFDPKGVFTFDGKCFTTQGVMKFAVYFPGKEAKSPEFRHQTRLKKIVFFPPHLLLLKGKAQGVKVVVKGSPGTSVVPLDPTVANLFSLSRRGAAFAVSDRSNHPTVGLMSAGMGARMNTVTDVPIAIVRVYTRS